MKGILFKAWKADAIRLSGTDRVWQTRRALKPQPPAVFGGGLYGAARGTLYYFGDEGSDVPTISYTLRPKYKAGEKVYVKERYDPAVWPACKTWKSPLFMPASAARTVLLITSVRVERTRDISWQDCMAEGIREWPGRTRIDWDTDTGATRTYIALYDSINGAGAHERNWDWVYSFRQVAI